MSTKTASTAKGAIIESRDQLIASFAKGEKPSDRWRIGTEHEKFVYALGDHHAPSYDEAAGIRALLGELEQYGWAPVLEGGNVIALTGADGSISLEPAGQFELSGAPLDNLHETCAETGRHLTQVRATSWAWAFWGWACGRTRLAPSCRSCPRGAMRSCCGTCRASARSAST